MPPASAAPVLFLAFADPQQRGGTRLAHLQAEADSLLTTLRRSERAGRCTLVHRENLTVGRLVDVFQDPAYRSRIALFHYAGHADSYDLLLQAAASDPAPTSGASLAAFLAHKPRAGPGLSQRLFHRRPCAGAVGCRRRRRDRHRP